MRVFDYRNKGLGGGFVAADSPAQAREYLVAQGCAKAPENIRLREVAPDSTDDYAVRYREVLRRNRPCLIVFEQQGSVPRAVAWHRRAV